MNLFEVYLRLSISIFLDALASLGFMLESHSVANVFEILSNFGHIFMLSSVYVHGVFRACSGYEEGIIRVCSE